MSLSGLQKKMLIRILLSLCIFVISITLSVLYKSLWQLCIVLHTLAYLTAGSKVFITAAKNILKGRVFDENFLMCIATIGAYILGDYTECVAVMLFYQIGEFFQSYAVAKSRKSIKDLMNICPEYANVERDGVLVSVDPCEVDPGDIITVRPGEKIPLDGIVTGGEGELDTASLTGESLPRMARDGDTVYSGCINLSSTLEIKVTKAFEDSTVSKILELVENSAFNKAKSERFITKFAKIYTPFVVIAALITAFIPPFFAGSLLMWVKRALIFLVISCPCALVISVPMCFFSSVGCASKQGILIKGANYLEAMGKLEVVVFDKTGTLTHGSFRVDKVKGTNCSAELLTEYAAAAEFYSIHPIAEAIKNYCPIKSFSDICNFKNHPGYGVSASYKGKNILAGTKEFLHKNGVALPHDEANGYAIHISCDKLYMGSIFLTDSLKDDALSALDTLKRSKIKTYVLSGDTEENVKSIAKNLPLDKVYGSLLPDDKVNKLKEIINSKRDKKNTVAYVGDGINDAPVLAMADIGIAMGSLGSDAAIEAADIVITDDKLSKIALCLKICKKTNAIVRQNIVFALGVKLGVMILGVLGLAGMWAAIFADVGVSIIAILNAMRAFKIN